MDTPGNTEFQGEVSTSIRITDGALVVVDAIEGICMPTESVLRLSIEDRVKPILMINKIERYILE